MGAAAVSARCLRSRGEKSQAAFSISPGPGRWRNTAHGFTMSSDASAAPLSALRWAGVLDRGRNTPIALPPHKLGRSEPFQRWRHGRGAEASRRLETGGRPVKMPHSRRHFCVPQGVSPATGALAWPAGAVAPAAVWAYVKPAVNLCNAPHLLTAVLPALAVVAAGQLLGAGRGGHSHVLPPWTEAVLKRLPMHGIAARLVLTPFPPATHERPAAESCYFATVA